METLFFFYLNKYGNFCYSCKLQLSEPVPKKGYLSEELVDHLNEQIRVWHWMVDKLP